MTRRRFFGTILLAGTLLAPVSASALTGSGDSPPFSLNTSWVSGVENLPDGPAVDRLGGCFPNPFNPLTRIRFELAAATVVNLRIYDMRGRLVRVLVADERLDSGRHESPWDGRNDQGAEVATGVYLYRLVTDRFSRTRRMTLMK